MDAEQTLFVKLSDATRLLRECRTITAVIEARDMAEALRHYAKVKGMSTDAANYATELRLRAERKLGEMLAQTIHRGRPPREDNGTDPGTFFGSPTLAELGVSKKASAFAQTIARLPDAAFESHIAETKARGQELTASRLYELARHTAQAAARQSARLAESGPLPAGVTLWVGDFTARGQQIPDGSVDLILTDPPYGHDFLPRLADLGALSARVLKPGGSLLLMYGQRYLLEALQTLHHYLHYQWVLAYALHGPATAQHPSHVHNHWKPFLWYVQGRYTGTYQGDRVDGEEGPDKRFDPWGQSVSGFAWLVRRFTEPGQVILDPCCGGGTTAVASVLLRRRFIGVDIDDGDINATRGRVAAIDASHSTCGHDEGVP
jgi:SAM-dependent methyltransferase